MNLCRCEKGHFYDKEKYATCPHCAGGSASDEGLTRAFAEDITVPVGGGQTVPVQQFTQPQRQEVPPVLPQSSLPVAGLSANQVTVAMNSLNGDTPTVPLDDPFRSEANVNVPADDDSDDHTVGFFDDVFPAAPDTGSAPPVRKSVKAPAAANKVSTPCVGWLIALGGEHIGTDFRLKVGKNFIGRNPQMDVALTEDKSVSRDRHAIVVYEPRAHLYLVQPGESSSLVYRNNEVVLTPMKLEAYDMITVGDVNLLFMPLCGERFNWGDYLDAMKKKDK